MNVMFISMMFPRPEKTLSGTFVLEQAKSLLTSGITIQVISPRPRRLLSGLTTLSRVRDFEFGNVLVDGIPVLYLDYPHVPLRVSTRFEAWSLTGRLLEAVRREQLRCDIDVLHAHQLFPVGYATALVGQRLDIPVVCTAHGSDVHTHPVRNRGIAHYSRAALRSVDQVVAVSADLADRILSLEPESAAVNVVYNGIDTARFVPMPDQLELRRSLGLPLKGVGICTVSRLVDAKGIPELVSAFRTVLAGTGNTWLAVAGEGPLKSRLQSWSRELGGRLLIMGPIAHEQVPEFLNAADIFALASHAEGVPVAMLEAMACGLPVVATAVGGIPEAVSDGEVGFLVRPHDESALAERLERLVHDAPLRLKLGTKARSVIRAGFQSHQGAIKLASLYAGIESDPASKDGRFGAAEQGSADDC